MQATEQHRIQTPLRKTYRFALLGLLFGFLGLGIATYRMAVEADEPTPAKTEQISEVLADTIKKAADKLRNRTEPEPAAQWTQSKKLGIGGIGLRFPGRGVRMCVMASRRASSLDLGRGVCGNCGAGMDPRGGSGRDRNLFRNFHFDPRKRVTRSPDAPLQAQGTRVKRFSLPHQLASCFHFGC